MNIATIPIASAQELFQLGQIAAQSGIFGDGVNPGTGVMIVMTCFNEGISPVEFTRRYDVISGKIAKKPRYMLVEFLQAGGRYKVEEYTDDTVAITFSYLDNTFTVRLTVEEMKARGIALGRNGNIKDNWRRFPRRMLFARCVSEGVGLVCPGVNVGIYTPEEVSDFTPAEIPLPSEEAEPTAPKEEPTH